MDWLAAAYPCVGDSVRNIDDAGGCLSFASCTWRAGSHTEPNRPRHSDYRDGVACHDIRGAGRAGNVARENQLARRWNCTMWNTVYEMQDLKLEGKYSLESTDLRESEIRAPPQITIALKRITYLLSQNYLRSRTVAWSLFTLEKIPVYGVFGQ